MGMVSGEGVVCMWGDGRGEGWSCMALGCLLCCTAAPIEASSHVNLRPPPQWRQIRIVKQLQCLSSFRCDRQRVEEGGLSLTSGSLHSRLCLNLVMSMCVSVRVHETGEESGGHQTQRRHMLCHTASCKTFRDAASQTRTRRMARRATRSAASASAIADSAVMVCSTSCVIDSSFVTDSTAL